MRSNWTKAIVTALGGVALALALTTAGPSSAEASWTGDRRVTPEIDPSALASTIALAIGGAAMLTDRRRKK